MAAGGVEQMLVDRDRESLVKVGVNWKFGWYESTYATSRQRLRQPAAKPRPSGRGFALRTPAASAGTTP
jgi:hypothetical protein